MRSLSFIRGGKYLLPLLVGVVACDQPMAPEIAPPEALEARKGGTDDGGHIALTYLLNDQPAGETGVSSDTEGLYIDGVGAGAGRPGNVEAYMALSGGKNAFLKTYWSTRDFCYDFDGTDPVIAGLISQGAFPGASFCAPSLFFMAHSSSFMTMPVMPEGATDAWNYAWYPALEVEFYPNPTLKEEGVTYEMHHSSVSVLRTAQDTWVVSTHEQTVTKLNVVRRKSNQFLGILDEPSVDWLGNPIMVTSMPVSFTMKLK